MQESRSFYTTPVWSIRSIRSQKNAELPFGSLHRYVSLTLRNSKPLTIQFKMVYQRLHRMFHHTTRRGHNLIIVRLIVTLGDKIYALLYNTQALSHLLNPY